jgi:hypothetical protein
MDPDSDPEPTIFVIDLQNEIMKFPVLKIDEYGGVTNTGGGVRLRIFSLAPKG